jgi:hypothetical protein
MTFMPTAAGPVQGFAELNADNEFGELRQIL